MIFKFGIAVSFFLNTCVCLAFSNSSLEREIQDPTNPQELRGELTSIRDRCARNSGLRNVKMAGKPRVFWYEYIPARTPTKKTIVFLPGGPGANSIGSIFLPESFNQIQIDPRGVGCNFGTQVDFSTDEMTTQESVKDVLNVLKAEHLESYVIYGHSYGTVAVTILASAIAKEAMIQPQAVILEGIFGIGHGSWKDYTFPRAERLNSELRVELIPVLNSIAVDEEGSSFVGWLFSRNYDDENPKQLDNLQKSLLGITNKNQFFETFNGDYGSWKVEMQAPPHHMPVKANFTLDSILCQEMYGTYEGGKYGIIFENGVFKVKIVRHEYQDRCRGFSFQGFNSAEYQIKQPIYYFQGLRDVATPPESARYHFRGQFSSPFKVFLELSDRGHSPLQIGLRSCLSIIFERIFDLEKSLTEVISPSGKCVL